MGRAIPVVLVAGALGSGKTTLMRRLLEAAAGAGLRPALLVNEFGALFYPDCASIPLQGRHLDYHWDGARVDLVRDAGTGAVFRIVDLPPDPV